MNWITIAWAAIASGTIEEMLTHLWKVLVGQLHGPLSFRLILQPSVAVILAIRAGLRDARAGRPAYLGAVLMDLDHRKDLLREGWKGCVQDFRRRRGPGRDLPAHRFSLALSWRSAVGRDRPSHCSVSGGSRPGQPHRGL